MTVLRPSLPPVISSTTRMLSLPGAAARAVRATNCGTIALRATSDEPWSVWVRNCRRVTIARFSLKVDEVRSRQLIVGRAQDRVDGLAHAAGQRRARGVALRHEGHELRPHLGADATGKVMIQQGAHDGLGTTQALLVQQPGR